MAKKVFICSEGITRGFPIMFSGKMCHDNIKSYKKTETLSIKYRFKKTAVGVNKSMAWFVQELKTGQIKAEVDSFIQY